jgi:hypothetical protein
MRRVGWAVLGAFGAAWLAPEPAWAGDAPPTYALAWVRAEGAEDCPSARALSAEVERRVGRKVFDVAAERSFEVEVMRFGSRYRSDVYVRDEAGRAVGHRTLESDEPSCGALFGATALAIALVIDPEAASRPAPAEATFEAPPTPPTPSPTPAPPAPPQSAAASPAVAVRLPPLVPEPRRETEVWLAPRGLISSGLVPPGASPGLSVSALVHPPGRWGFSTAVSYTLPRRVRELDSDVEVSLTRATVAVTVDALRGPRYRLLLSAGPSLGAFHVAVREPAPVINPGDFPFASLELGAEAQVLVTTDIFLDVGAQALVPLLTQRFETGGGGTTWEQPWIAGVGFLGVGARFP